MACAYPISTAPPVRTENLSPSVALYRGLQSMQRCGVMIDAVEIERRAAALVKGGGTGMDASPALRSDIE